MEMLFVGLAFSAGFLLVFGINLLLADVYEQQREAVRHRLEEEFRLQRRERARKHVDRQLHELVGEGLAAFNTKSSRRERLQQMIDEAGLDWRAEQLLALSGATGLLAASIVWAIVDSFLAAALAMPLGGVLPLLLVATLRTRRLEKMRSQLPEAFELMSRTMKAGQTISQALQSVADEFSPPIADEFGYCYDQQNLGLSPEASLRDLSRRTGVLEVKIFVLAVMIHRQTGGNLAQLLEKLSGVIRERYRIHGAIRALTAEGRLQALVLLALPPLMLALLLIVNRPYIMALFQHPALLIGSFVWMCVGALWMHKIINFDF